MLTHQTQAMNPDDDSLAEAKRKRETRRARRREAKRLVRDRKIYRKLRLHDDRARTLAAAFKVPIEPLSVYLPDRTTLKERAAAQFPVLTQFNGKRMPSWNDLSKWLQIQLIVMLLDNWTLLTFNVHLHPELERRLIDKGQDARKVLLASMRRELQRATGMRDREFYFVVEGWSDISKAPTILHVHGAVVVWENEDSTNHINALARACGHEVAGRGTTVRAVSCKPFTRQRAGYATYLMKATRRADSRLDERRRAAFSRPAVDAARLFWNEITGRSDSPR